MFISLDGHKNISESLIRINYSLELGICKLKLLSLNGDSAEWKILTFIGLIIIQDFPDVIHSLPVGRDRA